MAMYGSLYFVDSKRLPDDASAIPLVEGRSMVIDELCADSTRIYCTIPKQTWLKYEYSVSLEAIRKFVRNCIRRQVMETMLVEQQRGFHGGEEDDDDCQVGIPIPGVTGDTLVEMGGPLTWMIV